ncbi:reverse transcriptase domain-containing protein [Moorena sp. SIO4A1]|uniref:reverse transcriptase domain-containing protein n=1 Tax=Moorena sp. SIO4A1 TaxID=2607835 RepID=UPI0025F3A77B|nr:reverse transcriptase domain-containing protein [Moorena sp. SIO4A1]
MGSILLLSHCPTFPLFLLFLSALNFLFFGIFNFINKKPKWVLDADIAKCFDKINHDALLTKLNTYPSMRRLIKSWLKAGVMDKGIFSHTNEGTPQGGVISPQKREHSPPRNGTRGMELCQLYQGEKNILQKRISPN